jgi:hypothetical protein
MVGFVMDWPNKNGFALFFRGSGCLALIAGAQSGRNDGEDKQGKTPLKDVKHGRGPDI